MIHIEMVDQKVLLAGLLGAIIWNLITLILGLPTSSSHALMGGYGGAAVAHAGYRALILSGWVKPVLFIFLSPIVGAVTAIILTITASWIVRKQRPRRVDKIFRRLQLLSAALFSLGHGTNDSQKGMGIITAALLAGGLLPEFKVPYWVIICCHLAMGGGTMAGGWRIIKTMGQRIYEADAVRRIFGGDCGWADSGDERRVWHPCQHDAHDHGRNCRRRSFAPHYCGALGRDAAHRVGLGADDSRRGDDWRGDLSGCVDRTALMGCYNSLLGYFGAVPIRL